MADMETNAVMAPPMVHAAVSRAAQPSFDQVWGAIFADASSTVRTVLFTSASRHEGVSTLVAGTALTAANMGFTRRIGLLDLNLRFPRLASLVRATPTPGLTDVLTGRAQVEQIAQTVGFGNLTLYPAGAAAHDLGRQGGGPDTALSLLGGQALKALIGELAGRHDYLLCDCAAVNLYPDAQILAPLFDAVVLVAEAGATRRESLGEARKRIELGRGRVLGVVLNKRRYPVPRFLYRRS